MLVSGTVHELSEAAILQMIGRAGRPQFDDHGVAVIMTQSNKVVSFFKLFYFLVVRKYYLHIRLNGRYSTKIQENQFILELVVFLSIKILF